MPDAEMIALVLDIILYVVLGLVALKSFIGLFKGLWKEICSFVVSLIFYVLIIVFNTKITESIYNFDLSFCSVHFDINECDICLTTIGETIRQVIISLASGTADISQNSNVFKACDALSLSILSFVVLIINIILVTFVIVPIVSFVIYHCILKFILGKNVTKKHKLKLAGFFVGMVKAVVTTSLFLSPFTALCNTVSDVVENYEFEGDAEQFKKYVNAYNDSSLAKLFTSIKVNGTSLDVSLTNFATEFFVGDKATYFLDEVSMVTDIACNGIVDGIVSLDGSEIEAIKYLSKGFVTNVLIHLADSPVMITLLPVAITIVANLDEIKDKAAFLQEVDWYDLDWGNDLTILSDVYGEFYDTGLIEGFFDTEKLYDYSFNVENYETFKGIFNDLSNCGMINEIMPHIFNSFAIYLQDGEFDGLLPVGIENYQDINYGEELSKVYDTIMIISELSNYVFNETSVVNTMRLKNQSDRYYLKINDLVNEDRRNELINFLLSSDAINGGNDDIEFVSSDGHKISTEMIFNGRDEVEVDGILDSSLIGNNIDVLLKYAINSNDELSQYGLSEVLDEINDEINWENEVRDLLHIYSILVNNDNLNFNDEEFDIFDENVINELRKMTDYLDSTLIQKMIKPIMSSLLGDQGKYGLNVDNFKFDFTEDENVKFSEEFDKLLDVLRDIGKIQFDGEDIFNTINSEFVTTLKSVLDNVYDSKILNSNPDRENELNNFETLILNLFSSDEMIEVGFSSLTPDDLTSIRDNNGGWKTEISNICSALDKLSDNETIKYLTSSDRGEDIDFNNIKGEDIESLIISFTNSKIISKSISSILDTYLSESIDSFGLDITFDDKINWKQEATSLGNVIDSFKELTIEDGFGVSLDFSNLSLESLREIEPKEDGTTVTGELKTLLEALSELQSVNIGDVFYSITTSVLSNYIDETSEAKIKADHYFEKDSIVYSIENGNKQQYIKWANDSETSNEGQYVIDDIISLLDHILYTTDDNGNYIYSFDNGFNIDNALAKEGELKTLVSKLNNVYIWRTVVGDLISTSVDDLLDSNSIDGLNLDLLNKNFINDVTYECNEVQNRKLEIDDRKNEFDYIVNAYESLDKLMGEDNSLNLSLDKLDDNSINNLSELLNNMAKSKFFNIKLEDKEETFFQNTIIYMLNISGIDEMMCYGKDETNKTKWISNAVHSIPNGLDTDDSNGWINTDDEINKFVTAIEKALDIKDLFTNKDITNIEFSENNNIDKVIKAFANSDVLNYQNSLGNILNSLLKEPIESNTGLVIDFTKVGEYKPSEPTETDSEKNTRIKEWNLEAENLSNLINVFKNDENKVNFIVDYTDSGKLENVLTSICKLQVVQNNVYKDENSEIKLLNNGMDNFGHFVYEKITSQAFSEYSYNLEKVLADHNIQSSRYCYSNEINVSWISDNESYKGEISNFITLISNIKFDENNSNISINNDDMGTIATNLNNNYILRNLITPILKEYINDENNSIEGINLSKANVSIFDNLLNTYRNQEIDCRQNEIDVLIDIVDSVNTLSDLNDLNSFETTIIDTINNLLTNMHKSKVFSTNDTEWKDKNITNDSTNKDKFTIFEDVVDYVIDKSGIKSMIEYDEITTETLISEISSLEKGENSIVCWEDKETIGTNNTENTTYGEITKLCDILSLAKDNGLSSLNKAMDLDKDNVKRILTSINQSYLCHNAVANIVNEMYGSTGIKNYSIIKNNEIDAHKLDTYIMTRDDLSKWTTDVENWDKDIASIAEIYPKLKEIKDEGFGAYKDTNGNLTSGIFESIIKYVGNSNHLDGNREDIIYGIFKDVGINTYIYLLSNNDNVDINDGFNSDDLQRRNTLATLVSKENISWENEGKALDDLITIVNESNAYKGNAFIKETNTTVIRNAMEATYNNTETGTERYYLASELLAGFLESYTSQYLDSSDYYDWRNNSEMNNRDLDKNDYTPDFTYESFNEKEINGFIGIIDFVVAINDFDNQKDDCVKYTKWNEGIKENIGIMDNSIIAKKLFVEFTKSELKNYLGNVSIQFNRKDNTINDLWNDPLSAVFYGLHNIAVLGNHNTDCKQ